MQEKEGEKMNLLIMLGVGCIIALILIGLWEATK
jgi:hypothetical protein